MPKYSVYSLGELDIKYIVSDLNGTLALDGDMIEGVKEKFSSLSQAGLEIYVLTGDIHGNADKMLADYNCKIHVVDITEQREKQDQQKLNFINELGAQNVCAIGNGGNNSLMLKHAGIGILITGQEGGSTLSLIHI